MKSILTCQTIEIGLKNGMSKELSARGEAVLNCSMSCTVKCNFFQHGLEIMIQDCFPTQSAALISILAFKFYFDLKFPEYLKILGQSGLLAGGVRAAHRAQIHAIFFFKLKFNKKVK